MPPKADKKEKEEKDQGNDEIKFDYNKIKKLPNKFDGSPAKLNAFLFDFNVHRADMPPRAQTMMLLAALEGQAHTIGMYATNGGASLNDPQLIVDALKREIPPGTITQAAMARYNDTKQGPQELASTFVVRFTAAYREYEMALDTRLTPPVLLDAFKSRLQRPYLHYLLSCPLPRDETAFAAACEAVRRYDDIVRLQAAPSFAVQAVDMGCFSCGQQGHKARDCPRGPPDHNPNPWQRVSNRRGGGSQQRFRRRQPQRQPQGRQHGQVARGNTDGQQWCFAHGQCKHSSTDCQVLKKMSETNSGGPDARRGSRSVNMIRFTPEEFFAASGGAPMDEDAEEVYSIHSDGMEELLSPMPALEPDHTLGRRAKGCDGGAPAVLS